MVANSSVFCRIAVTTCCIRWLLTIKADILSFLQEEDAFDAPTPMHARRTGWRHGQREISNPSAAISSMRSRAQRMSTQRAPPSHCQGSDTTFSSTQLRAALLTGLIEMIEP